MSAILVTIATIAVNGRDALEQYVAGTIPLIQAAGGKMICRLQIADTVVGDNNARPDLIAVMKFDSKNAILSFLNSAEYRHQVPHRDRAFARIHSYIAGEI